MTDDLIRLYQFLLDRASTVEDLDVAERALSAITSAVSNVIACTTGMSLNVTELDKRLRSEFRL